MLAVQSKTSKLKQKIENGGNATDSLNLYNKLPALELSLDEFEVYALKRLKVLRKIETLKNLRVTPEQARPKIEALIQQEELNDQKIDECSHFILRLSYCQSEELRKWFLQQECALFQHRLSHLTTQQLEHSVKAYAKLTAISTAQKEFLAPLLRRLYTSAEFATMSFYAVPFTQALDLVAKRHAVVRDGMAYVPHARVVTLLNAKFRMELSRKLTLMGQQQSYSKADAANPEATRVYPLLKNLNQCLVSSNNASADAGMLRVVNAATVDSLVKNMPLCMRGLHRGMQKEKHLRHWGRLQYGLFLKGAGLDMEDAILFFQRHFSKVTGEEFQKQYAYNIRHMYGKEGKRASYTPYSCSKVILGNAPTFGDHHGCPYKHYDAEHLSSTLQQLQIGDASDRADIVRLKKEGQFQLACQQHFMVTHPRAVEKHVNMDNLGNHPNAWFRSSVEYFAEEGSKDVVTAQVSPEKL